MPPSASSILHLPQQILCFVWGNKLSLVYKQKHNEGRVSGDCEHGCSSVSYMVGLAYVFIVDEDRNGAQDVRVSSAPFQQPLKIKPFFQRLNLVCLAIGSHLEVQDD